MLDNDPIYTQADMDIAQAALTLYKKARNEAYAMIWAIVIEHGGEIGITTEVQIDSLNEGNVLKTWNDPADRKFMIKATYPKEKEKL